MNKNKFVTKRQYFDVLKETRINRKKIMKLFFNACSNCTSEENLHIHHKHYEYFDINDLLVLCSSCHKALHKREGKKRFIKDMDYITKTVCILQKHNKWLNKNSISLSKYVRSNIENDIKNEDET